MTELKNEQTKAYKGIRWQVQFFFIFSLFSCFCHLVSGELYYSIFEEIKKDFIIGNIAKDIGLDVKELPIRNLRIVSRISEKYFYVNFENGNLYAKDRIDRETLCGAADSCFLTFDAVLANPLNVFSVKIEIQDINDNAPIFFHDIITLEIIELTLPGARFVLQNAEDPDIGINSVQTYKLNDNQYFILSERISSDGSKTPELVLEKPLDCETQNVHELILTALDGGNPVQTGTALIKVVVNDVNDNAPIFTQEVYKVIISENMQINSTVLCVTASDKDEGSNGEIAYSFRKTAMNILNMDMFSINYANGEINSKRNFDFELTKQYELSIQAKDGGGLVAHSKVLIEITDENDNAPEISVTSLTSPIQEDSLPGTVVSLIEVHDQDSGENGEADCHVIENVPFELIISSGSGSYYRMVTSGFIDRESKSSYNITLLATDKGSPPLSRRKIIRLDISDVNDNPPVFSKSNYVVYVPENNLPGASIYNIHASDLDSDNNAKVVYLILSTHTDGISVSSYFSINFDTGVLYAQRSFDYEQNKEFHIQIIAKDNGFPSLNSTTTVSVLIVDQNDHAPNILYPTPESDGSNIFEMVPFASEEGSLITKVIAVDADSGHNSWLSYHFIHEGDQSYFSINQYTGEIRTSRVFQEKDNLKQKIVVMVKDNGNPSLSATITVNLIVADNFYPVLPNLINQVTDNETKSNLQLYLVIALAVISFLFLFTVILAIISKYRRERPSTSFGSLGTNLYSQNLYSHVDPQILSNFNNGTLTLPYSYNVCVALDSSGSDFKFMKPEQNVPTDNLIDADDGIRNENPRESLPPNSIIQVS
ncbi:protocadherin gamma-B2-like [Bombina bombina]|uniref:protocadherin gamma-B2-like n=1 Tax=Bombina bombina TaxID=8345 RepID=UPI00235A81C2|nr:protocadherin gamma-B2-like [Bombina bombina]